MTLSPLGRTFAAILIGSWLLVPVPIWLLAMGFGGEFFLPSFGLSAAGDATVDFVVSVFFYGPWLLLIPMIFRAPREQGSRG